MSPGVSDQLGLQVFAEPGTFSARPVSHAGTKGTVILFDARDRSMTSQFRHGSKNVSECPPVGAARTGH